MLVARCEITYSGRLEARLGVGTRLLLMKEDGSVSVHAEIGGYKPLNWMTPRTVIVDGVGADGVRELRVAKPTTGELLLIRIFEVVSDVDVPCCGEAGLVKSGEEAELQALLAADPEIVEPGLGLIRREAPTDLGPVDLLCRDAEGVAVAVEIKRRGEIAGVEQLARYVERLNRDPAMTGPGPVRGVLAALEVRPQARVLAEARGLGWVEVDLAALREEATPALALF